MQSYLQTLLASGVLTHAQFSDAIANITGKKERKKRISRAEKERRTALRSICKWMFDVEIDRPNTPLYEKHGNEEKIQEAVFLRIANQIILYMANHPVVAAEKCRAHLIETIRNLVKIRRNNMTNHKKPTRKPLRLIYENQQSFVLYDQQGNSVEIPRPEPLPAQPSLLVKSEELLPDAIGSATVTTYVPSVQKPPATITPQKPLATITPPVDTKPVKRTLFTPSARVTPPENTCPIIRETVFATSSPEYIVVGDSDDSSESDNCNAVRSSQSLLIDKIKAMQQELDTLRAASTTTSEPAWMSAAKQTTTSPQPTFICCIGDCQKQLLPDQAKPEGKRTEDTHTTHTHVIQFDRTHTHTRPTNIIVSSHTCDVTHTTGGKKRYCPEHWEERKTYLKSITSAKGAKKKLPLKRKAPDTVTADAKGAKEKLPLKRKAPDTPTADEKHSDTTPSRQTKFKIDEIVHAQWDQHDKQKYAAQVLSVQDNKSYNLFFLDGNPKFAVPERVIKPLGKRDREDQLVGKKFVDEGGVSRDGRKNFKKGEFVVLARALIKVMNVREVSYWCERQITGVRERDVVLFGRHYIKKMINKYEKRIE